MRIDQESGIVARCGRAYLFSFLLLSFKIGTRDMNDQFDLKMSSFKLWKNSDKTIPTNHLQNYSMLNISKGDSYGNNDGEVSNVMHLPTSPTNGISCYETRPFSLINNPHVMSVDMESSLRHSSSSSSRDMIPYNYKPFFGDRLVSQSRIDALREAEVTEHCLIFHKDIEHDINFRPDLYLNCGHDRYNHGTYTTNRNDRNNNDNEDGTIHHLKRGEESYRLKRESHRIIKKTHHNLNLSINPRGFLEKFWKGSDLLYSLDPNYLEMLSAIVWEESEAIYKIQLHLNHEDGSSSDLDISKSARLRRNYQRALAKASYIRRPSK